MATGDIVKTPWGQEIFIHDEPGSPFRVKYLVIKPGGSMNLHYHDQKYEFIYVLHGFGYFDFENVTYAIRPGDRFAIPSTKVHRLYSGPNSEMTIIECSSGDDSDIVEVEG